MDKNQFRSGYVALVGKPNVGKSTLLNALLKFKLAIVTEKPQTTRKKILGILNGDNYQLVVIDTPGIIEPRYDLQKIMMQYINQALSDADVVCLLVDATLPVDAGPGSIQLANKNRPVILVLNKIDLVAKERLLPLIDEYRKLYPFQALIPLSGLQNDGVDVLLDTVVSLLPEHPAYYPPDYASDQTERFFVTEIVREKIFQLYQKEIPYACHVEIEEFRERPGRKDYIRVVILVDQSSQKGILIGKEGRALKQMGELARNDIEVFLERPVFLELYVKVLENWRKKMSKLKSLGY